MTEAENNPKCFRALVRGRVQGVGFRYCTREKAQQLGLAGHVRNCWDGTVEVVAQGEAVALGRLLSWLHRGPGLAQVTHVQVNWEKSTQRPQTFEVRF